MFVTSLQYGSPTGDRNLANPEWDSVEMHLRLLDGDSSDGVILGSSGNSYLGVSGGRGNQYVVAGYIAGFGSFILANGEKGHGTRQVVVNGDFNNYPARHVVGLDDAIAAAKEFFESGDLVKGFIWEKQTLTNK
jgi:hypothetical protein